jgi:hypothetical protein
MIKIQIVLEIKFMIKTNTYILFYSLEDTNYERLKILNFSLVVKFIYEILFIFFYGINSVIDLNSPANFNFI